MTPLTFVLLSGTLSFGVPLAFAIRELLMLSTSPGGGGEPPAEERLPSAPRPLPACLLPAPAPVTDPLRIRLFEDA